MLKKKYLAMAIAAAITASSGIAFAADAPAEAAKPEEAKGPYTLTGNFGIFSQYIFRGLTQTDRRPALQGGFDFSHESGFYVGTWLSNISWLRENLTTAAAKTGTYSAGGSLEMDIYGGYKWSLPNDFVLDLGTLYYWYPGDINPISGLGTTPPKADTWELYISPSWKWLSAKYSYSIKSDTFGVRDSKGTSYLEFNVAYPIEDTGFTLIAHYGWQKYRGTDTNNTLIAGSLPSNDTLYTYKDIKLGASYALPKDFTIGAFYSKALSQNKVGYGGFNDTPAGPYPRDIGKGTATVYVQKTF